MSVLIADLEVFEAVYSKINTFQFNKQCNINYCNTLSMDEVEGKEFVSNLLILNELSYLKRYREEGAPHLYQFLKFGWNKAQISTLQLLKYLHCIEYNIEMHTIKTGYAGGENNAKYKSAQFLSASVIYNDHLKTLTADQKNTFLDCRLNHLKTI